MSHPSPALAAPAERSTPADVASDLLFVQSGGRTRLPIADHLTRAGLRVAVAPDIAEALRLVADGGIRLCLLDLTQDRAALTATRLIRSRSPHVALAAVTDVSNPVIAAEAIHAGVTDLLPWPVEPDEVALLLANARDRGVADPHGTAPASARSLFTQSPAMRHLASQLEAAAASHQHVCLVGEGATGRTLIAQTLHAMSGSPPDRFVAVDCAAEPADVEWRLFGGGADGRDTGRSGQSVAERLQGECALLGATGGTLFLSHVGEAPARVQARLARVLRDREATLDGATVVALDVRLMLSVEPDVDALVSDGRLHADLAARASQVRIDVPPLRRRAQDIPLLVAHFARQAATSQGVAPKAFSRAALAMLAALPWHGNALELLTAVDTLTRSVTRRVIQIEDVLTHAALDGFTARVDTGGSLREARARFERECISAMLMRHHGRVGEAAKALGIQRTNLYRKVRQLNVSRALLSSKR